MPSVFTIQGPELTEGKGCRRVRTGKRRGCTIVQCQKETGKGRGRWQFKKGTMRCS